MTVQQVSGATAVVFALGVVMVGPVNAQARRDGRLLPQEESGQVTAVGCLVRGSTMKGGKDKYVLARVKKGTYRQRARGNVHGGPRCRCPAAR